MRIVGFVFAGILIFFGVLFIWGAFSPQGQWGWIIVGLISVGLGLAILYLVNNSKEKPFEQQALKVHIDLPADVNLETLKCQSCGGNLTPSRTFNWSLEARLSIVLTAIRPIN